MDQSPNFSLLSFICFVPSYLTKAYLTVLSWVYPNLGLGEYPIVSRWGGGMLLARTYQCVR